MILNELIKTRRTELGMTKNSLAKKTGISHTEICRIESGERKQPSLDKLKALSIALSIPFGEIVDAAGYCEESYKSDIERALPGLNTDKQVETIRYIANSIAINDLGNEELDTLCQYLDMLVAYKKQNGVKTLQKGNKLKPNGNKTKKRSRIMCK